MADTNFDVIVVGGGPGGYVAAIRAAQLKLKTAVVEKAHLGGICLNWGCIPTKALLRSAEIYHYMEHADAYGLKAGSVGFDLGKVVARSRAVSKQLNGGVGHLLKKRRRMSRSPLPGQSAQRQRRLSHHRDKPVPCASPRARVA